MNVFPLSARYCWLVGMNSRESIGRKVTTVLKKKRRVWIGLDWVGLGWVGLRCVACVRAWGREQTLIASIFLQSKHDYICNGLLD